MPQDDKTHLWRRAARPGSDDTSIDDPLHLMRSALADVRRAPDDEEARRRLRAIAADHGMWDQLAVLLADEARAAEDERIAAAFYEELADVHDNLEQPLESIAAMEQVVRLAPDDGAAHDRLARLYHGAGAWTK